MVAAVFLNGQPITHWFDFGSLSLTGEGLTLTLREQTDIINAVTALMALENARNQQVNTPPPTTSGAMGTRDIQERQFRISLKNYEEAVKRIPKFDGTRSTHLIR